MEKDNEYKVWQDEEDFLLHPEIEAIWDNKERKWFKIIRIKNNS